MATITAAAFRGNFPEFASVTVYPDVQVNFWLGIAAKQVRPQAWRDQVDLGVQLFAAHNLVLEAQAVKASKTGSSPGASVGGPVNSKSVDKVSIGYDTGSASVEGAGNWNLTNYGTRYKYFLSLFGAGGIQIGAGGLGPVC